MEEKNNKNIKNVTIGIIILVIIGIVFVSGCVSQNSEVNKDSGIKWKEVKLNDETIVLKPGAIYYYGGTYKSTDKTVKYHYTVTSSTPVDIYVVASESDFRLIKTGESFVQYPSCRGIQVLRYDKECTISNDGGITIINKDNENAVVTLQVYYFKPDIS